MLQTSLTFGRLFGIRLAVSPSWFFVFALLTAGLGAVYFPREYPRWPAVLNWAVALATSLLFFLSVLLHELGHSLVALRHDVPVRSITLFLFGGVSQMGREAPSPRVEFLVALAGPLVSLALAAVLAAVYVWSGRQSEVVRAVSSYLAITNAMLGIFNLLPGFPLDGGRLFRALAWYAADDFRWATRVATWGGQFAAATVVLAGVCLAILQPRAGLANGFWLVLIGWFLFSAAQQNYRAVMLLEALDGLRAGDVMRRDPLVVDARSTLAELGGLLLASPGREPLIVVSNSMPVGLADHVSLRKADQAGLQHVLVEQAMRRISPDLVLDIATPAGEALQRLAEGGVAALPVLENGQVAGLLRYDDLQRHIELRRRLSRRT